MSETRPSTAAQGESRGAGADQPSRPTAGIGAGAAPGPASGAPRHTTFPGPAAFRPPGAGPQETLVGQVAFAMAAETGTPPRDAQAMQALRDQAATALSDFAFRYLHNQAEEIRREAAADAVARAGRGPRFVTLVLANLAALAIVATVALVVAGHPALLAGLGGR